MDKLSGVFGVFKPKGLSCAQVLARVQAVVAADSAYIAPTLPDFAEGVCVVGLNIPPRLRKQDTVQYWLNEAASQACVIKGRFGVRSDSGDLTGRLRRAYIQRHQDLAPDRIQEVIFKYMGVFAQTRLEYGSDQKPPPLPSNLNVMNTVRLKTKTNKYKMLIDPTPTASRFPHELARIVNIRSCYLTEFNGTDFTLETVSNGIFYPRSLIEDIAYDLHTSAVTKSLFRTRVSRFRFDSYKTVRLDELSEHRIERVITSEKDFQNLSKRE